MGQFYDIREDTMTKLQQKPMTCARAQAIVARAKKPRDNQPWNDVSLAVLHIFNCTSADCIGLRDGANAIQMTNNLRDIRRG